MPHLHLNPYRQPRPKRADIIARRTFFPADDDGRYVRTDRLGLTLCRDYLWVNAALSIPLACVTELGLSKRGGYIQYFDSIENGEVRFNFTSLGFLRYTRRHIESFLAEVSAHLPAEVEPGREAEEADAGLTDTLRCERCGAPDANVYTFYTFQFVGIVLVAYSYKLEPLQYVLCHDHARGQAFRASLRTGTVGYLGVPGCLAAPWYVCKNLSSLRRGGAGSFRATLLCGVGGIVVPAGAIAALIAWIVRAAQAS